MEKCPPNSSKPTFFFKSFQNIKIQQIYQYKISNKNSVVTVLNTNRYDDNAIYFFKSESFFIDSRYSTFVDFAYVFDAVFCYYFRFRQKLTHLEVEDQELAYEGREYWMDDLGLLRAEATDDVAGNADDEIAVGVAAENKVFFRVISKHKLK